MPGAPRASELRRCGSGAWARLPQRDDFAAEQNTDAARFAAGGALFPNAPTLSGSYANDHVAGSNVGYVTSQARLSTPIWLPGEGTATQRVAEAKAAAARGDQEAAHLALAADVLDLATSAAIAADAEATARDRLATAEALERAAAERFRTGESAESDELAATAEAASARIDANDAGTRLQSARAALASVTGMEAIPDLDAKLPAAAAADIAANPRLLAEDRHVAAAREQARLVRIQNRDDPEIGVQVIDDKQPGTRWDTRVALMFTLPFATEARNAPRRAAAEQAVTEAMVQRELTRRSILVAVRQAVAAYEGAAKDARDAAAAAAALRRRRDQLRHAWLLGEMPLIELIRADNSAFDAAFARRRAGTELASARLKLAIAQGTLP